MKIHYIFQIFMIAAFLMFNTSMSFSEESGSSEYKHFLDTLEDRSDMYLLYVIEYGSHDAKVRAFQILSERGAGNQDVLDMAHDYLVYGYNDVFSENQAPKESSDVRYWALQTVKVFGDTNSVPYIVALLDVEDSIDVIRSAVSALGNIKSSQSLNALFMILTKNGNNPGIVAEAVVSLGEIGDPKAIYKLIEISEDYRYRESVRALAAEAAGKLGDPEYKPRTTSVEIQQQSKASE